MNSILVLGLKGRLTIAAAVILLGAALSFAYLASADVSGTLLPVSDGSYKQWTRVPSGSTHYTAVDESSCNGTTDYIRETTVGERESFGVSLSSVPDGAVITDIAITPCASRDRSTGAGGSSTLNVFYRWNGADSADAGGYALTGTTPTNLAPTTFSGLALSKGGSSTLEIGPVFSSGNRGARVSRLAAAVTYTTITSTTTATTTLP